MTKAQNVLISGGTSGIGRACAERLRRDGARVFVLGTSPERVTETVASLDLAGGMACDVSDEAQVDAALASALEALGSLEAVFANAGIDGSGDPAVDLDVEQFRRVLDVNVIGTFLVARAGARVLSKPGAIVLNASVNALRPETGFTDYNASKAAVVSIAKTMALELSASGIAVVALCPGYFPTRMTAPYLDDATTRAEILARVPAGRVGTLEELASLVAFLVDPRAFYLTGSVVSPDGGSSI